jgi:hypothetical protein
MKIDKVNNSFNTYKLELSFGELAAIANALEDSTDTNPIADECRQGIRWYLDNLPGPGEDKAEFNAKKKAEKEVGLDGEGGEGGEKTPETAAPADLALPPEKSGPDLEPHKKEIDGVLAEPPAE